MTRTYQVTGIILKGMPLGEADRLVTILSPEVGLIRAVAPGARKHHSQLRGRCDLLVVNQLLIAKGKTLDKITQADTIKTYPGLSRDLGKLAGSQYLAELVLCLALSEQPQSDLYELFTGHLSRLETLSHPHSLHSYLAQGVFHLLAISGIVPQVHRCCLTQSILSADFTDSQWRVGFSFDAGGLINLSAQTAIAASTNISSADNRQSSPFKVNNKLGAVELTLLQHLGNHSLPELAQILPQDALNSSLDVAWMRVERLLRDYAEYHLDRSFRAAILVDSLSSVDF